MAHEIIVPPSLVAHTGYVKTGRRMKRSTNGRPRSKGGKIFWVDDDGWEFVWRDASGPWSNSYSGGDMSNGRIKKPFDVNGKHYVCLGFDSVSMVRGRYEAWEVVPLDQWDAAADGPTTTYYGKVGHGSFDRTCGDAARSDPRGFYHGMVASHGKRQWVVRGPKVWLIVSTASTIVCQLDLFQKEHN